MKVTPTAHYPTLKGRVAIITGGGQALGRAYAHHLAAQGAIPVIAEFNAEDGARKALFVATDVGSAAAIGAMAETVLSRFGRIDILVNNAALFSKITMKPFWELP